MDKKVLSEFEATVKAACDNIRQMLCAEKIEKKEVEKIETKKAEKVETKSVQKSEAKTVEKIETKNVKKSETKSEKKIKGGMAVLGMLRNLVEAYKNKEELKL